MGSLSNRIEGAVADVHDSTQRLDSRREEVLRSEQREEVTKVKLFPSRVLEKEIQGQ